MVSKGNKAKLVSSEICQKCAKCCKEFNMSCDGNCAIRLMWAENNKIKSSDTPFRFGDGVEEKEVCFKMPCSKLIFKDRKYYCSVWNDERPDFCNTYPDHIFYNVETWNTQKIKEMLEFESKSCPALKDVSVEQVQEMLKEYRGEE